MAIFDLNCGGSTDEIDSMVKLLKESPKLEKEITFILISSVMSWGGTPAKLPKDETLSMEDEEISDSEMIRRTTTDFLETDYLMRRPLTRF